MTNKTKQAIFLLGFAVNAFGTIEFTPAALEDRFAAAEVVARVAVLSTVEPKPWPTDVRGKLVRADCAAVVSVMTVYKGEAPRQIRISEPQVDPMLGFPTIAGAEYLLFLRKNEKGQFAIASIAGAIVSLPSSRQMAGLRLTVPWLLRTKCCRLLMALTNKTQTPH